MPDEKPSEILGSLPRRRPQRRSDKRGEPADRTPRTERSDRPTRQRRPRADALRQPQQPPGTPPAPRARRPIPASGTELLSTVAQATAELAEIGLSVSARALRNALGRLPRP